MYQGSADAEQAAMKILGSDGKIPPSDKVIAKPSSARGKAGEQFTKDVNQLNSSLLDYQNSCSDLANAVGNYMNTLNKDDFGLDAKNQDNAKKIAQAKKLLVGFYTDAQKRIQDDVKKLDQFDKNISDFTKFKPALFW
jgi:uncharacterized protein YukE